MKWQLQIWIYCMFNKIKTTYMGKNEEVKYVMFVHRYTAVTSCVFMLANSGYTDLVQVSNLEFLLGWLYIALFCVRSKCNGTANTTDSASWTSTLLLLLYIRLVSVILSNELSSVSEVSYVWAPSALLTFVQQAVTYVMDLPRHRGLWVRKARKACCITTCSRTSM